MRSLKKINLTAVLILAMILSACTQKNIILEIPPTDIREKVVEANQSVCSYKGRVSVIYESINDNLRFKGYLNKDCADNFRLKILGLFNSVAYDVNYKNGQVEAYKKGEDVSLIWRILCVRRGGWTVWFHSFATLMLKLTTALRSRLWLTSI